MSEEVTREKWLENAIEKFRPLFIKHKKEIPPYKVSCGFPSKGPLKNLGECWPEDATTDGVRHIFISPINKDAIETLGTLLHELIHVVVGPEFQHGPEFKELAYAIGLEGKARTCGPGYTLFPLIEQIVDELGPYPNPTIKLKEKSLEQKARSKKSFKLFCEKKRNCEKSCLLLEKSIETDYTVTATKKNLKLGMPSCPCSEPMIFEEEDFALFNLEEDDK